MVQTIRSLYFNTHCECCGLVICVVVGSNTPCNRITSFKVMSDFAEDICRGEYECK